MPKEDGSKSLKQRVALLVHSRKVAADAAKGRGPIIAAEGASHFLLNLDHAQIAFGLIVGKGDGQVIQEGQHLMSSMQQRIQQILGFGLCVWAPLAWRSWHSRGLSSISDGQDAEVASHPSITDLLWDAAGSKI